MPGVKQGLSTFAVFAILGAQCVTASTDGKCRALVLSGGGSNGAWEAGVMWGLTHYGDPEDFYWDVHAGISAGSWNTLSQVGYAPEDTYEATQYIYDQWTSLTSNDQVYIDWADSGKSAYPQCCLEEVSCQNDDPLLTWLDGLIVNFSEIKRRFIINAVDVETGDYITFDQTNTVLEEMPQASLSSSSIPLFWQPQHFKGHILIDGGSVWNLNPISAIQQCLEIVDSEEDIIMDVAIYSDDYVQAETEVGSTLPNMLRAHNIRKSRNGIDMIDNALRAYPDVNYRNIFLNENPEKALDFRSETIQPKLESGRQQAKDQLEASQNGFNGFTMLQKWKQAEKAGNDLQKEHSSFFSYFQSELSKALGRRD